MDSMQYLECARTEMFSITGEGHTAIGEEVLVEDLAARKVIMLEKARSLSS